MKTKIFKNIMKTWLAAVVMMGASLNAQAQGVVKEVEFVDLNGNQVMLSDFRGKWVVVNLWATWCPPCRVEIPDLIMFQDKHKDTAVVLGVDYEDIEPHKVQAFAESQMINYPIVRFTGKIDGKSSPFGPVRGLPTTYMVTPKGELVAARTGMIDDKTIESFIENYEKQNP